MIMADDIDALLHSEQFQHDYRQCEGCGLHAWFDDSYPPMRVAWRGLCYTCKIRHEVALTRKKNDDLLKNQVNLG